MADDSVAQDQLRAFIERLERMHEERKAIAADISEIYAEAKGNGFDVPAIKTVLKIRGMDHSERMEREGIVDVYLSALGMQPVAYSAAEIDEPARPSRAPARAHVENIDEFGAGRGVDGGSTPPAKSDRIRITKYDDGSADYEEIDGETGEVLTSKTFEQQPAPAARDLTESQALTGQVADIQPETATEQRVNVLPQHEVSEAAGGEPGQATVHNVGVTGGERPATNILTREQGILKLRPNCQQPGACKSSGGKSHCWSCEKASSSRYAGDVA